MVVFETREALLASTGTALGLSDWVTIDQRRIDLFAEATGDHQWIHVDPVRAAAGPFGATIAHGYLTLSLVNLFLPQLIDVRNISMGVNYGCERIRFPAAVRVGSRLRGRGEVISVEPVGADAAQAVIRVVIELEGSERPACIAAAICRYYYPEESDHA